MGFVPLRDKVGFSVIDFLATQMSRSVIIWGTGFLGKCLIRQFMRAKFNQIYLTDSFKVIDSPEFEGYSFTKPEQAVELARLGEASVVVAVQPMPNSLKHRLSEAGLREGIEFIGIQRLSRPSPVVDIYDAAARAFMREDYAKLVANKLASDYPDVFQIDISSNGYSFYNPEVAEVALVFEKVAPCTLSFKSSCFYPERVRRCIDVGISQITFLAGYHSSESEIEALRGFAALLSERGSEGLKTEIRVRYDVFKSNLENLTDLRGECARLRLPFVAALGYPNHYDSLVHCDDGQVDSLVRPHSIAWSFTVAKELAMKDRGHPCLCERVFPVVAATGEARLCHLYSEVALSKDYVSLSRAELRSMRAEASHCRTCQSQGLHRLDVAVLERRHGTPIASESFRMLKG